ncbi:alpha/beta-hydrolase [Serendipita vermifera]|nr:alpha/beta-hydrolase [Serendipita vermifera]
MSTRNILFSLVIVPISLIIYNSYFSIVTVQVETNHAVYHGVKSESGIGTIFYGIPYAHPPVGERRFRAPVPIDEEEELQKNGGKKKTVKATRKPDFCIQGPAYSRTQGGAGSEDCLHLNIYTPTSALASASPDGYPSKLPVLVYIHGGGFIYGNPLSWPFEHWIEQFPDVVIVSIYYRLSVFGFLSTPEGNGLDHNAGFLDQVEALKWVKKNVESFGGDPNQITIDGQSAGGASVLLHLLAYEGKQQLFHQAIAHSIYRPEFRRAAETKEHFDFVAAEAGCGGSDIDSEDRVECLRSKDVATIMRAAEATQYTDKTWRFLPVVDGHIFKDTPTQLAVHNKISHVPVLVGATTDESFTSTENLGEELRHWYPNLRDEDVEKVAKVYKGGPFRDELDRVSAAIGEPLLRCGRETLVSVETKAGQPSYSYRFDEPNPTTRREGDEGRVHHSAENWWMHQGSNTGNNGTFALTPFTTASQKSFAKELIAYWLSFVRSGDPNTYALPDSPKWPVWDNAKYLGRRMVLKQGETVELAEGVERYVSGSKVEIVKGAEVTRCKEMNKLASRLHF